MKNALKFKIMAIIGVLFLVWMAFGAGERAAFLHKNIHIKGTPVQFSSFMKDVDQHILKGKLIVLPDSKLQFRGKLSKKNVTLDILKFDSLFTHKDIRAIKKAGIITVGTISSHVESAIPSRYQIEIGSLMQTVGTSLYTLILIGFIVYLVYYFKQNAGGGGIFSPRFNKVEVGPNIRMSDVAGMEGPKLEVQEIIEFLKNPKMFARHSARVPKGVLLYGLPGNGKTMLAKAIAGEANVGFIEQDAASFVQVFAGAGAMSVRTLFSNARKEAKTTGGCIIFIDELDAVGGNRGSNMGYNQETNQTLNALLTEMDGFKSNDKIIVIAATNRIDTLDPALLRPGRFDRKVYVPQPGKEAREEILALYLLKYPSSDVTPDKLSGMSMGMSGADLANWVNEAAIEASRMDSERMTMEHFNLARDRILIGPKNMGIKLNDVDRDGVAWHESGHAIVNIALGGTVSKVSIIPRGPALGVTFSEPDETTIQFRKSDLLRDMAVLMGGRVAEELYTKSITSGASNDIERASVLAFKAVTTMGLGDNGVFSPQTEFGRARAEREAEKIVQAGYDEAKRIITESAEAMKLLYDVLVSKDEAYVETISVVKNAMRSSHPDWPIVIQNEQLV